MKTEASWCRKEENYRENGGFLHGTMTPMCRHNVVEPVGLRGDLTSEQRGRGALRTDGT